MTSIPAQHGTNALDYDAFVGRRVHQLMWDQKMTQTAFGERIGMDQSLVAKRLRGKVGWGVQNLVDAAKILNTTVAYLVGETEDPTPPRPVSVGAEGLEPPASSV